MAPISEKIFQTLLTDNKIMLCIVFTSCTGSHQSKQKIIAKIKKRKMTTKKQQNKMCCNPLRKGPTLPGET